MIRKIKAFILAAKQAYILYRKTNVPRLILIKSILRTSWDLLKNKNN
jgi:hypothetical protein